MARKISLDSVEEKIAQSSLSESQKDELLIQLRQEPPLLFDPECCIRAGEKIGSAMGAIVGAIAGNAVSSIFQNLHWAVESVEQSENENERTETDDCGDTNDDTPHSENTNHSRNENAATDDEGFDFIDTAAQAVEDFFTGAAEGIERFVDNWGES